MIRIGTFEFDRFTGNIVLPSVSATPFVQAGTAHVGVQIQPIAGRPFTLRVWRVDASNYLLANLNVQKARIGNDDTLFAFSTNITTTFGYRFFVNDVREVESDIIPFASGSRFGVPYSHTPASFLVTDWELIAVPA
ncbi:MAG: hypothetical protein AAGC97_03545 [Planctomycetota bacterium]